MSKALKRPAKHPPVLSKLQPDRYFGAISETHQRAINAFSGSGSWRRETRAKLDERKLEQVLHLKCLRACVHPGEAVGVLAAQAIGEPSTQMTLNTFHFAGRSDMNVTLGIPRLREILMSAGAKIKTPIMKVALAPRGAADNQKRGLKLVGRLRRVMLSDVLQKASVRERLVLGPPRRREYELELHFIPPAEYKQAFSIGPKAVMKRVEAFLKDDLLPMALKELKGAAAAAAQALATAAVEEEEEAATAEQDVGGGGEEPAAPRYSDDSDSEADAEEEEDLGTAQNRRSKRQRGVYEGEEGMEGSSGDESGATSPGPREEEDRLSPERTSGGTSERSRYVVQGDNIEAYEYDPDHRWCRVRFVFDGTEDQIPFVQILERLASTVTIRAVRNINRAALVKSSANLAAPDIFQVEGQALQELWNFPSELALQTLRSNDIVAMLHTYGVEAARATIVDQVNEVFGVYGIKVNPRHMAVVADYMTHAGGYRGFNRMGINANASPLLKMSFETTFDFLTKAALAGTVDENASSSAQIVTGQLTHGGTGAFDLKATLVG